ncbi:MAG TPA: hypothetical protein VMZ71_10640 [Gemmataceae bacterium]|nr:hypothetical protein [Gemmataceae bacterium]
MTPLIWLCFPQLLAVPVLVVEPETTSLKVGDPLIIKATLRNTTPKAIEVARPFDAGWTGVMFDIRGPGDREFRRACIWNQGLKCGSARPPLINPGERLVTYERSVPPGQGEPDFSRPGVWRLRAFSQVNGRRLESNVVGITVKKRPPAAERAWDEHPKRVTDLLFRGASADSDESAEFERQFAGSNAALTLVRARHLKALRSAVTLRARQDAMAAIRSFREDLLPVTREYFDLETCNVLIGLKDFDAAEALLKTITEPSGMKYGVFCNLEAHRPAKP